jgi:hypothetical protein
MHYQCNINLALNREVEKVLHQSCSFWIFQEKEIPLNSPIQEDLLDININSFAVRYT